MSIQESYQSKFLRIIDKDLILRNADRVRRYLGYDKCLPVYFHYRHWRQHAFYVDRYYGDDKPVEWAPLGRARLLHIAGPEEDRLKALNKDIICEPNDCAWAIYPQLVAEREKGKQILEEAKDYVYSNRVKAILTGSEEISEQYVHIFGEAIRGKLVYTPSIYRMRPREDAINAILCRDDMLRKGGPLRVLCLSSNAETKATREVVRAWQALGQVESQLIMVVPKLNESLRQELKYMKNVCLIEKAPLSAKERESLLRSCDISICCTWWDGGTNAIEALEYGHVVLCNSTHRDTAFEALGATVFENNIKYYDIRYYGERWRDLREYMKYVYSEECNEERDSFVNQLTSKLMEIINARSMMVSLRLGVLDKWSPYSIYRSNQQLTSLYCRHLAG
jgi:hypothetical protein